jgi:HEAT repeat protein
VTIPSGPGVGGDPTTPVLNPIDSISEEDVAPVPKGKLISEMTDTEVLGVLVSSDSPEAMVLRALREARTRKLPKILEATVKVLDNDSYVVRIETIKLVGELGDRRIVPKLVTKLDDHDAVVRRYAAQVLGKLGSRKSLAYLSSRYLKEPNAEVKKEIRSSIEKINGFPMEAGIDPISEAAAKKKLMEQSKKP